MTPGAASTGSAAPTLDFERARLGRLEFTTGSRAAGVALVQRWFDDPDRSGISVGFVNPHVYNSAVDHPEVAGFLSDCSFVCVDGVGVAVASRWFERVSLPRVVATSLFEELMGDSGAAARSGRPMEALLIGTTAAEVEAAAEAINTRLRGVHVVGTMDGFRDLSDYQSLLEQHREVDAVLVGAGAPRSEQILLQAAAICRRAVAFHIGAGTIKLYAGTKRRAPRLMSRLGIEWVHRMLFEPHTRSRYGSGAISFARDVAATTNKEAAR